MAAVLGLNCSHDAAACIVIDGEVACAVSEERLTRQKHQRGYPRKAIDYCLNSAGLQPGAFADSVIVINYHPPADFEREALRQFPELTPDRVLVNPSHHLLHASYVRALAPDLYPMAILIADGSGYSFCEHQRQRSPLLGRRPRYADAAEALTAFYVDGQNGTSLLLKDWGTWKDAGPNLRFPSLGHMYGSVAQRIFGSWTHAGKVMGLAPFGDGGSFGERPIVELNKKGIKVDTEWMLTLPPVPFQTDFENSPVAAGLAARVQSELERAMLHLAEILYARTKCETLGLSGGVALNSACNGRLARESSFDRIVITPAAHDSGTAIGAAAYGWHFLTGSYPRLDRNADFLGKEYSQADIEDVRAANQHLVWERIDDSARMAAEELARGRIIGWFEGRSEFGPRALGHRSILADPRTKAIKTTLNSRIKFREAFRPYAAAVLEERCNDWFYQPVSSPHMLMVATVRESCRDRIPAVVHVDHSCRLQTIDTSYSGSLRKIIEHFDELTGIPLILNTSLNIHGEPTAETPQDAIDCVKRSGLEVLYIGGFRVSRPASPLQVLEPEHSVIEMSCEFAMSVDFNQGTDLKIRPGRSFAHQERRMIPLTPVQAEILISCHRGYTLHYLLASLYKGSEADILKEVQELLNLGLIRTITSG